MKKYLFCALFIILSHVAICQTPSYLKLNTARQINELFLSAVVDSGSIVSVDKMGTMHITFAGKDEVIDLNIMDLTKLEVSEPGDKDPSLSIYMRCKNCMSLTSPSAEKRAAFDKTQFVIPIKYKAMGIKIITKLDELQKQNKK